MNMSAQVTCDQVLGRRDYVLETRRHRDLPPELENVSDKEKSSFSPIHHVREISLYYTSEI